MNLYSNAHDVSIDINIALNILKVNVTLNMSRITWFIIFT